MAGSKMSSCAQNKTASGGASCRRRTAQEREGRIFSRGPAQRGTKATLEEPFDQGFDKLNLTAQDKHELAAFGA